MSAVTASSRPPDAITRRMRERRIADQIGRIGLALMLILVAVIFLVVPFQAITWMQQPYLGTFLEYPLAANLDVTRLFINTGPTIGVATDLRQDDTVLAIDGVPVNNARDLYRIVRIHQPGDQVTLDVLSGTGNQRQVFVLLEELPLNVGLTLFAIAYLAGLTYLAIGLWVYRSRRDQAVGRAFLTLCISIALLLGTTFDLWTTHTFARLWAASIPWAGMALLVFALVFPSESPTIARHPALRHLPAIPTVLIIVWAQLQLNGSHAEVVSAWQVGYAYAGICIVAFLVSMLARGIFAVSPTVREQSRVVLVGAALAFVPFAVRYGFNLIDLRIGWVLLASMLFPLTIAYSIVQYSVLDTGRILSFTATYAIMAAIVTVGYGLVVAGLNMIASIVLLGDVTAANPALAGLLAFALVLAFQPARRRLQGIIDNLFFRSRSEYQERLTAFRHNLTLASGLGEVVRLLKQQIRETLMPTHVYVFLRDPQTNTFIAVGEGSRPDTDIRFEAQSGLVHALSTTRDLIFLELNKPLPPELIEEHARLAVLRTPALAPLQGQDRLAGWVAIGNKRSGEPFTIQDLRFIQALAEQASLAVERAQVIGDLERRVRELDVLSQVSQAVNFTADPDVLLELIYAQTSKLIDTTNFYIIMHDPERKGLSHAFFLEGDKRYPEREGRPWPDAEGLAAEVVRTGRPIHTIDYVAECVERGVPPHNRKHRGWMGVPLNSGARTLGAMVVASYMPGIIFTEEQLKVFWAIADQAATALDKARLFSETQTRARQLATLNEISKELSSTLDLENLLRRIMSSAVEILNAEAGTLYLVDENELVFRVIWGGAQDLVGRRMPINKGIAGQAATTGQPAVSNNVLQDKRWFSEVDRESAFQTQALLAVPLLLHDSVIGVVQIINKKDGSPFVEEDIALLTTFAAQAAIAIENARLYEATDAELEARIDELQNMLRIDRELNRTLEFDRVVQITIDWAQRITGASASALAMLDAEQGGINILASIGYSQEFLDKYRDTPVPLDEGLVGRVLTTGKAEFVTDVRQDPDYVAGAEQETVAQITVPMLRANRPIGALVLESHIEGLLDERDYEFAQRLVEHAAVAIDNARLVTEIEEANRSKTEFISLVSHELKNPMTSIRGYTDLLKSGQVGEISDTQGQFLGTIRSNVDRMTRLVSDLADSARIETGHLHIEMGPTSVPAVVEETLRAIQGQIEEKEQELVVELEDDLPFIYADHTRMVQVLTNLVSNAHKYTPDKGRITVAAKVETITDEESGESRDMVHHWVSDTGIGLTEEELEKLFTKFFRSERGKDMAQGTGLGLTITKSLVDWHHGTIWVESKVGEGTTFHYTIPVFDEEQFAAEHDQVAD